MKECMDTGAGPHVCGPFLMFSMSVLTLADGLCCDWFIYLILCWCWMLHKDYDRKCSIERKKSGREPQGAWGQDELISGKQPVVK
jgi:hypothetical protein